MSGRTAFVRPQRAQAVAAVVLVAVGGGLAAAPLTPAFYGPALL